MNCYIQIIFIIIVFKNFLTKLHLFQAFFFFFFFKDLLIYWLIEWLLCWVFVSVLGPSLVAASGGHSSPRCAGPSPPRPPLLRSTGSRHAGSAIVAHGPSRSAACGIFPDQGSNPCPPHWQADSQPLRHQGSPISGFDEMIDKVTVTRIQYDDLALTLINCASRACLLPQLICIPLKRCGTRDLLDIVSWGICNFVYHVDHFLAHIKALDIKNIRWRQISMN